MKERLGMKNVFRLQDVDEEFIDRYIAYYKDEDARLRPIVMTVAIWVCVNGDGNIANAMRTAIQWVYARVNRCDIRAYEVVS
jgi:hypothetical protein